MSGVGVRIAAIMKFTKIAYFLLRLRKLTLINPIFAKKTIKIGISKIAPNARSNLIASEKYSLTAGKDVRNSLLYPTRNLNAGGKTTKYPKAAPPMKQKVESIVNGTITRFSWLNKPGATKRQIWEKTTGQASNKPQTRASFR
jgi:hypothetical protein